MIYAWLCVFAQKAVPYFILPYNDKQLFIILCKSWKQASLVTEHFGPRSREFSDQNDFLSCLPHIGSLLFRISAYTGAKQASRVPFWFRDLSRKNHLVPGHLSHFFVRVISYHFSGHLVPSFIIGFNSLMLFFYVSKFTF